LNHQFSRHPLGPLPFSSPNRIIGTAIQLPNGADNDKLPAESTPVLPLRRTRLVSTAETQRHGGFRRDGCEMHEGKAFSKPFADLAVFARQNHFTATAGRRAGMN